MGVLSWFTTVPVTFPPRPAIVSPRRTPVLRMGTHEMTRRQQRDENSIAAVRAKTTRFMS